MAFFLRKAIPNQRRSLLPVVNKSADLRGCHYQCEKELKHLEQSIQMRYVYQLEQTKGPHDYQIVFSVRMHVTDDSLASPTATNYIRLPATGCSLNNPLF
jgi:hypothetical protein